MKQLKQAQSNTLVPFLKPSNFNSLGYSTLYEDWLALFPSAKTVRVYRQAISEFFSFICESGLNPDILAQFLLLEQPQASELVYQYQGWLTSKSLAPATINRKLASIKSLVNYGAEVGKCHYTLTNIKSKNVINYRDTSGIGSDSFKLILNQVDRTTIRGKRDYAILLLLWGNALRRSEVTNCRLCDYEPLEKRLWIVGKGRKGQSQPVSLGVSTINALNEWICAIRDFSSLPEYLFFALIEHHWGHQLTPESIYYLVRKYANKAGILKQLSPHRLRHSAITAALEITNGDVRAVQKLSRHSSLNTLMVYDDNRRNEQGRVTDMLEDLL